MTTRWRTAALLIPVVLVALAHALAVAPHYHVGSFDDDANYILVARALIHGAHFTTRLLPGLPLVATYPPGYGIVLAPLAWVFGTAVLPYRALSLILLAVVFPLAAVYLRRHGAPVAVVLGTGLLLALNPVLATYATMVMAELPYIVVLLLLLFAVERWGGESATFTWSALGAVAAAAGLLWLKEAGFGAVAGVAVWLAVRRSWRQAVVFTVGVGAAITPIFVARAAAGTALIGSRYSDELGGPANGGLVHGILHAPGTVWTYAASIVPRSVLPYDVVGGNHALHVAQVVSHGVVTPLVLVGFAVWAVRHRGAACALVAFYVGETVLYPFTNERRIVLVLPLVVLFFVVGVHAVAVRVAPAIAELSRLRRHLARGAVGVAAAAITVPLVAQFPRDYLFHLGQSSSQPAGSPAMTLLGHLGRPDDVVETDFVWTTALFSGHRTAKTAFGAGCDPAALVDGLVTDGARYVLSAALNGPGVVGDDCFRGWLDQDPATVRLLRTDHDLAAVFERIGPGTPGPGLRDLTAGATFRASGEVTATPEAPQSPMDTSGTYPVVAANGGRATVTWTWSGTPQVAQVSVGAAGAVAGATGQVAVALRSPAGAWVPLTSVAGAVGDGGVVPFVLVTVPAGVHATGIRVQVTGGPAVALHDVHVLGGGN